MSYEIQNRSDFLTGSDLVVSIPENELDQNALFTIQEDCPDFILPFNYKCVDGKVELVYKVGTMDKLYHFSGDLTPREYAGLWQSLLKPLLVCRDWFMNPGSFLIKADYLYFDKDKGVVRYVYIPSFYGCSGHDAFYEMAVEVSKMMTVSDAVLENKVLRAIIKDFNPLDFLKMLNDYLSDNTAPLKSATVYDESFEENIELAQDSTKASSGTGLRCVGRANLPQLIQVSIKEREIFTIGRVNSALGKRQSDFEFDKKTKAVNHRHAVIERAVDGYKIIDLSSSAGTYVDGERLSPNTPVILEEGCRISFGNSGVDYVWETY